MKLSNGQIITKSGDGGLLAVATNEGWLDLIGTKDWSLAVAGRKSQTSGLPIALTQDGSRIVGVGADGFTLDLWRTPDLQPTATLTGPVDLAYGFVGTTRAPDGTDRLVTRSHPDVVDSW